VPVFNEEQSVAICVETTKHILEAERLNYEFIFVNDGSQDGTAVRLFEFAERGDRIRIAILSRNFDYVWGAIYAKDPGHWIPACRIIQNFLRYLIGLSLANISN